MFWREGWIKDHQNPRPLTSSGAGQYTRSFCTELSTDAGDNSALEISCVPAGTSDPVLARRWSSRQHRET